MRVLVTGAGGFIGRTLVPMLNTLPETEVLSISGRAQLDLSDVSCLEALPAADAIIHLAGIVGVTPFDKDPLTSWQANLMSSLHILEHARRSGCQQLLLASSYVYGPPQYLPIDEAHPVAPTHAYQLSKYLTEQLAGQYARDHGFQLNILRLFNVYGPDQDACMLIPSLIAQLYNPQIRLRDPHPRRDYVHVRDVAAAFIAALRTKSEQPVNVYNIGSGYSLSVAELVETLLSRLSAADRPELLWGNERRPSDVDEVVADISKAQRELGWSPHIRLEEGFDELCAS